MMEFDTVQELMSDQECQLVPVSEEHEVLLECGLEDGEPVALEEGEELAPQPEPGLLVGPRHQRTVVAAEETS